MADKIFLNARYAFRSDTLSNWQRLNPVLEKGEPAVVTDGVNGEWLKIGDGINAFNSLGWKKGPKGEQGIRGIQGVKGDKGDTGASGPQGVKGDKGDKGEKGDKGVKGDKGDKGDKGEDGTIINLDQTHDPDSSNAQSGIAVAEAVAANKQYANNTFSAAIKNTVSGLVVSANDVSPIEHNLGVKVSSKNLFDKSIPYGDYLVIIGYRYLLIWVGKGNTVTVSLSQKHPMGLGGYCYIRDNGTNSGGSLEQKWLYHNTNDGLCNKSQTFTSVDGYVSVYFDITAYNNFKDELQVEYGTTATEYTPYVDLSTVNVSRYGKNLFDIDTYGNCTDIYNGPYVLDISHYAVGTKITISTKDIYMYKISNHVGGDATYQVQSNKHTYTLTQAMIDLKYLFIISTNTWTAESKENLQTQNVLVEFGDTATEYEPYIEPQTALVNADGTVTGLTSISPNMTIIADNNGANINVTYNVDTKTYIDNKFAELAQAILNT